jgi:hypothetical protein
MPDGLLPALALGGGMLLWIFHSRRIGRSIRSVEDWLRGPDESIQSWRIGFSSFASLVVVVGYVVFYVTYTQKWGLWIAIFPVINIVSFLVYSAILLKVRQVFAGNDEKLGVFVSLLHEAAPTQAFAKHISRYFTVFMMFILILGMSAEAWYGAKVLSMVTKEAISPPWMFLLIVVTSILVAHWGGFRAVLRCDLTQSLLLLLFIALVLWQLFSQNSMSTTQSVPQLSSNEVWTFGILCVNAMVIPYVSMNPWHLFSLRNSGQNATFLDVLKLPFFLGILALNLVTLILIVALYVGTTDTLGYLAPLLLNSAGTKNLSTWVLTIGGLFVAAALLSTIDSFLLSHYYHAYKSFKTDALGTESRNGSAPDLREARFWFSLTYLLFFIATLMVISSGDDLINILIRIGGCIIVIAPWIFQCTIRKALSVSVAHSKLQIWLIISLVTANFLYLWSPAPSAMGQLSFLLLSIALNVGFLLLACYRHQSVES